MPSSDLKIKLPVDTKPLETALAEVRRHIEAFVAWYETLPEPVKAYLRFSAAMRQLEEAANRPADKLR